MTNAITITDLGAAPLPYRRQSRGYSCGAACAWMMFRGLGLRASEQRLMRILGTASRRGTWPDDWHKLTSAFPVVVTTADQLSLRQLENRRRQGWQQTMLITTDVPHYVVYLGRDGGDVVVHDPWSGPERRIPARQFTRRWQVVDTWTSRSIFASHHWAVAIRQRHHWRPGQKLAIEEIADGVILRAQSVRPDLRRLVGIADYRDPAKSLAEMAAAIAQGARRHDPREQLPGDHELLCLPGRASEPKENVRRIPGTTK